jgi:hypothetical protein
MWTHPLIIAIVAGFISGIASTLLTIFLSPRLQHHFWKLQRADELRLAAISDYNRLTQEYLAACVAHPEIDRPVEEWLRDLNVAASTIRVLFSDAVYQSARAISERIRPYSEWVPLPRQERLRRANELSDLCHGTLGALYRELLGKSGSPLNAPSLPRTG